MVIAIKKKFLFICSLVLFIFNFPVYAQALFNYGEALQKAIFFYDIQRLGKISEAMGNLSNRVYWRDDSFLQDYALPNQEGAVDLGGGFSDAGDNIKFNFPMASATSLLAWSVVAFQPAFVSSHQLTSMLSNLRWANDYLLKCWDANHQRLYGQVSPNSVSASHSTMWMPFEVIDQATMDKNLPRYAFYVDPNHPGTDLAGETVAALAASSLAFKESDPAYASKLLSAAKAIYNNLVNVPNKGKYSDNMGRMVNGSWQKADIDAFYKSWSGYRDEVSWSSMWLYRATEDPAYLSIAKQYIDFGNLAATQSWDDKSYGSYLLLAKFLPSSDPMQASAKSSAEQWLDSWAQGKNGHIFSNDGLAIATALSPWGNARYAASTAFGALIYDTYFGTNTYHAFAKSQIDYLLGNNSKHYSYLAGFGTQSPKQPHHATAQGRWDGINDVSNPDDNRHLIIGGLVGGPKDANDTYEDKRNDYIGNEVALDYNAGLVGALAVLYGEYGGMPLPDGQFPPSRATENPPLDEYFVNGAIQSSFIDHTHSSIQVSLLATNHTAWPARVSKNLKIRYFLNLADQPSNGTVKVNVFSTDPRAVVSDLKLYDASNQIYYVEVWFKDIPIYPGGDERAVSSKETQLQFNFSWAHDFTKDWSYQGLGLQGNHKEVSNIPIYDIMNGSDERLFGKEPTSVPQGILKLNFAPNLPSPCVGAKDILHIGLNHHPSFTVSTALSYSMEAGGPYAISVQSAAQPIMVTGGTCEGLLNASQVNVPGEVTANYAFTPTPPMDQGQIQVMASSQSDPNCNQANDTLFLDQNPGASFVVVNGVTETVNAGPHQLRLASENPIPAGGNLPGKCKSTLDQTTVTVEKDQTAHVTARYQYQEDPTGMACIIQNASVIQQSDWGPVYGLVNTFDITFTLKNFPHDPNGKTLIDGNFTMKNDFVQKFWGNFSMSSSSINQNMGAFTGEVWGNEPSVSLGGFIDNKKFPLHVGDNPMQTIMINGVVCH